ncbi:hypothetical protein BJ508DRAFT_332627 [Ascobolus immersus RN42]|uniref:Uncharacterized protein n=1 Tax=Ascobolus immersus RN42 TaxID=1160509 RepID=A0A3N4HM58_ASCIM|nr:hypothetical protein BJ508DRAFT_332627 [Ascobolus immersus RN42]
MKLTAAFLNLFALSLVSALPPTPTSKRVTNDLPPFSIPENMHAWPVDPFDIPSPFKQGDVGPSSFPKALDARDPQPIPTTYYDQFPKPGVYLCTGYNFTGSCWYLQWWNTIKADTCFNMPQDWNDKISSVGPDIGWYSCIFYA